MHIIFKWIGIDKNPTVFHIPNKHQNSNMTMTVKRLSAILFVKIIYTSVEYFLFFMLLMVS